VASTGFWATVAEALCWGIAAMIIYDLARSVSLALYNVTHNLPVYIDNISKPVSWVRARLLDDAKIKTV
jgi:hypothetical protein